MGRRCARPAGENGYPPCVLRKLLKRAREAAEERLPAEIVDAGKRVAAEVEHRLESALGGTTEEPHAPTREEAIQDEIAKARERMDDDVAQVIVYATEEEREDVEAIRKVFAGHDEPIRVMDISGDPRTRRNLAGFSGVMVPPWVCIDGHYWGARYDVEALDAEGDLPKILAGELEALSDVAMKIGKLHEAFSDAMTVENIRDRLGRGHCLCIDDIDSWMEEEGGEPVLYHQGGRITGGEIERTIVEVAGQIEAGIVEALWRLEPEVKVG